MRYEITVISALFICDAEIVVDTPEEISAPIDQKRPRDDRNLIIQGYREIKMSTVVREKSGTIINEQVYQ